VFHSSQPIAGEDVRWHPDLVVRVPAQGGEITAVIEHNQRVIVFKKNAIYAVSGDGPGLTGQGGAFQVDQLSTSYGCEGPNGVQLIPDGVVFKTAENGYWLINNRYEIEYVGRGVDSYKGDAVTASVHVPDQNQVRFIHSQSGTITYVLVYDYYYKQWTRFIYRPSVEGLIKDMCFSGDGRLYMLIDAAADTPTVAYENPASYVDIDYIPGGEGEDDSTYDVQIVTGWLNFADIDGHQRIKYFDIQGTQEVPEDLECDVAVNVYYNYNSLTGDTYNFSWTGVDVLEFPEDSKLMRRIFPLTQKARAAQIWLTIKGNNFSETTLNSLTFRLGLKKKAAPADESQRS
jgi:hypothetical protein